MAANYTQLLPNQTGLVGVHLNKVFQKIKKEVFTFTL